MRTSRIELELPDATSIEITDDTLAVDLSDGRTIIVPIVWYPRLLKARPEELANWRFIGGGQGIHWDALDEDISVENLLTGRPSGESQESYKRWLASRQ
jgi:hypothetical protein